MSTPIRQQYLRIKHEHPDAILFFRLGDFYETFDEDAEIASRELEIVLTSKPLGKDLRVPLAGIPVHSLTQHVTKLVARGYKVAICEQLEDPASVKGLVDRGVIRVITPGTAIDASMLDPRETALVAALAPQSNVVGLAWADLSTGDFATAQLAAADLPDELGRLAPRELLVPDSSSLDLPSLPASVTRREAWRFEAARARQTLVQYFNVANLEGYGCERLSAATAAAGALLDYLQDTQKGTLGRLTALRTYTVSGFMALDSQTRRNLELTEGSRGGKAGSLISILDECSTPAGGRLLRQWLNQPLLDIPAIESRLDAVEVAAGHGLTRAALRESLKTVADVARIAGRLRSRSATPRDLSALCRSLDAATGLRDQAHVLPDWVSGTGLDLCADIHSTLRAALVDDPRPSVGEGGVFREGFSDELDGFLAAASNARTYIAGLEARERERTGIKSLKVGFNRVFGYYLEVSNANRDQVPDDFIRKQTLVGAERYITPELKEYEAIVLNAQDRLAEIEKSLYDRLLEQLDASRVRLERLAAWLAELDVVCALAEAAVRRRLVRPVLTDQPCLSITGGRHLVVEAGLPAGDFVQNDTTLDPASPIVILTGPNMAGKSTYLRQVALIVLLAQCGSFVPADSATVGIADRIFTRIGAQDDIASGQSTFMVEMVETARILHHATPNSLVILDEIGRGTSTYDGLAIAQSLVEYLHNNPKLRCRTLFATHYHELTELAARLPGVINATMAVSEGPQGIVFLRQVIPGKADRSYGVHVAELAGLPRAVTSRAAELLTTMESQAGPTVRPVPQPVAAPQLTLFAESPAIAILRDLDPNQLTPIEALTRLYELKQAVDGD